METENAVELSKSERDMATLAHISHIVFPLLGPLVVYVINIRSKFVSFHAVQAMLMTCLVGVVAFLLCGFGVIAMVVFAALTGAHAGGPLSALGTLGIMVLGLAFFGLIGIGNLVLSAMYAQKANQGEWAPYPVVGEWAKRIVGVSQS